MCMCDLFANMLMIIIILIMISITENKRCVTIVAYPVTLLVYVASVVVDPARCSAKRSQR